MLEWFKCPDGATVKVEDCLKCVTKCRLGDTCLTLPTRHRIANERVWKGEPSTTQLLNGTMQEFLKLTQPYIADPDKRAFMIAGTGHHENLEEYAKALGLPSELPLSIDRDIFDLLEPEDGGWSLTDYKLWGSYRVAKALGLVEVGKAPDPSGAIYKKSGAWGQAGSPKMVSVFQAMEQEVDLFESELQLNHYRIKLEDLGIHVSRMQLQVTVRDGGLAVASSRGITRNIYKIPIKIIPTDRVLEYFTKKRQDLLTAIEWNKWEQPCDNRECWDGVRCRDYCEVAIHCPKGLLYQGGRK